MSKPLVSICCITYNHVRFIDQAIQSFLNQKTGFEFEVIINDDCSTDGTTEKLREYQREYPDKIRLVLHDKNEWQQGKRGIFARNTFPLARGKYIALCEGDDFWNNDQKLQIQVGFLEKNEDYSAFAHQASVVSEDGQHVLRDVFKADVPETLLLRNFIGSRWFHTASLMFRTRLVKENQLPTNVASGDRALYLLLSSFGKVYFSDKVMCGYRKNTASMSAQVSASLLKEDLNIIPWMKKINPDFPAAKYAQHLHHSILSYSKNLTKNIAFRHLIGYIYYSFHNFPGNLIPVARFLKNDFPEIWKKTSSQ